MIKFVIIILLVLGVNCIDFTNYPNIVLDIKIDDVYSVRKDKVTGQYVMDRKMLNVDANNWKAFYGRTGQNELVYQVESGSRNFHMMRRKDGSNEEVMTISVTKSKLNIWLNYKSVEDNEIIDCHFEINCAQESRNCGQNHIVYQCTIQVIMKASVLIKSYNKLPIGYLEQQINKI